MPTLRFEGCSDDTFGEYAATNEDHDNCADGTPIRWLVEAGNERLLVIGQYSPDGAAGWQIGVAAVDDPDDDIGDPQIPEWPMHFERSERPYSPALVIEAPDGVTLRCLEVTEDR